MDVMTSACHLMHVHGSAAVDPLTSRTASLKDYFGFFVHFKLLERGCHIAPFNF